MEYMNVLYSFDFTDSVIRNGLLLVLFVLVSWNIVRVLKSWNLKNPPGPIGLPVLGYVPFLGKEDYKTLWNLRKKYGDIIGLYLGPQYTVVLNEYTLAKEVLSHPAALNRPPDILGYIPKPGFGSENGDVWLEQRKFIHSSTLAASTRDGIWEDLIMEEVSSFVNGIRAKKGDAVDITHSLSTSVICNLLSILIGRRLKKEESDKIDLVVEYSEIVFLGTGTSKPASVIPGFRKFCEVFRIGKYHRVSEVVQKFTNFVSEEVNRHRTSTTHKDIDDFINTYLNKISEMKKSGNKKHSFTEDMLEGNVNVLFLGGTDTIIGSLGWLLRLMAKHNDIQKKVYAEIMDVIGYEGRAKYRERHNLPYTFAVLMETQRVSSVVPLSTTRRMAQDLQIRGITIPKDSHVTANLWGLHHDPNYWENPEEFRPERFLTENGTKIITQPPSYLPFSIGRRNCPGEIIAWMEILLYFTEIVKNFEISTPSGMEPNFDVIGGLVSHLVGQPLCFKERKTNA